MSFRDPEYWTKQNDGFIMTLLFSEAPFDQQLMIMDFASFPLFNVLLRYRQLATHRLELPLGPRAIARTFGLQVAFVTAPEEVPQPAELAFRALKDFNWQSHEKVAIVVSCWGQKHSRRLILWLKAVRLVSKTPVLVLCYDRAALAVCRYHHRQVQFCVEALQWPKSGLSKLVAMAMVLEQGVDALWLDDDTLVLKDPTKYLKPMMPRSTSAIQPPRAPQMLFQIEGDSWNCINNGIFLIRAAETTRRYLAYWTSLLLDRPTSSDQLVLQLLLQLVPEMDFSAFARREGLISSADPGAPNRNGLIGPFRTPPWGGLDPQAQFPMVAEVTYGGFLESFDDNLVILHLLESWPKDGLINPLYNDLRKSGEDVLTRMLKGAVFRGAHMNITRSLLARSVRDRWSLEEDSDIRRDCRVFSVPGR